MKKIAVAAQVAVTVFGVVVSSIAQSVVINEVFHDAVGTDTGKEWIELYNPSGSAIVLTGYDLCGRVSGGDYTFPVFTLPANSYVVVYWNTVGTNTGTELYTGSSGFSNISDSEGSVSLFNSTTYNSTTIVDFVQWGAGDQTFENYAVSKGIWTEDDFVAKVDPGHSMEYDGSGDTSSDWFDQSSPTQGAENSLPVELSSFSANATYGKVILTWQTESEIDNQGFYVLRSDVEDGEFDIISNLIDGAGTTTTPQKYEFVDENVQSNKTYWYKLKQVDFSGQWELYGPIEVFVPEAEESSPLNVPATHQLYQNYPNPFNPETTILYAVAGADAQQVRLTIHDLQGRVVATLVNDYQQAGEYSVRWDGRDETGLELPSGLYMYRICCGSSFTTSRVMIKLR